jgi:hypothetical protein
MEKVRSNRFRYLWTFKQKLNVAKKINIKKWRSNKKVEIYTWKRKISRRSETNNEKVL